MTIHGEWEGVAADWAQFATTEDPFFERNASAFLRLLPGPPQRVVDVGCGEGRFDRLLVGAGYDVVGFDSSPSLIALAAAADPRSAYRVADAASLPLEANSADLVVSFQGLHAIRDLEGACGEAHRVLHRDGSFCFAILHPIATSGDYDKNGAKRRFVLGDYMIERSVRRPLYGGEVTHYHRPVSRYVSALQEAGFRVDRMTELTGRDETQPIPMFLHVVATKDHH